MKWCKHHEMCGVHHLCRPLYESTVDGMDQCELSFSVVLWHVSKRHVLQHKLLCTGKKKALLQEFEHDSIASHKENAQADLQAVWDDDCMLYCMQHSMLHCIQYHKVYCIQYLTHTILYTKM